jgi:hypothetical protein
MFTKLLGASAAFAIGGFIVAGGGIFDHSASLGDPGSRQVVSTAIVPIAFAQHRTGSAARTRISPMEDTQCYGQVQNGVYRDCSEYNDTPPAVRKDVRDCMVVGGMGGAAGSFGGPPGAAAGAAAGCAGAVYSNHSH